MLLESGGSSWTGCVPVFSRERVLRVRLRDIEATAAVSVRYIGALLGVEDEELEEHVDVVFVVVTSTTAPWGALVDLRSSAP